MPYEKPCSADNHREYRKCSTPRARSQVTALNKYKYKLTKHKINSIHENRFDFEILDINVGQNSSTALAAGDVP